MSPIDFTSDPTPRREPEKPVEENTGADRRRFLGVRFNCCGVYVHVYVNREGTAYEGHCPKCYKQVKFPIGNGGTSHRFFEVY